MNVNIQRFNSGLQKEKLTQDSGFPENEAVSHGEWFPAFARLKVLYLQEGGLNMQPYAHTHTNLFISYIQQYNLCQTVHFSYLMTPIHAVIKNVQVQ